MAPRSISILELRLGWPATEWETGPEPKMAAEKWPPAILGGGVLRWPKNGRANGWTCRKSPNFSCPAICPAIFRPFWNPPKKWLPAISPAIFDSGPASHSVAGRPSRNPRESSERVTWKVRGVRCERFDRTLSVVLKTLSLGFYRTFSRAKRGSIEPSLNIFWDKIFPPREKWANFPSEGKFSLWEIIFPWK